MSNQAQIFTGLYYMHYMLRYTRREDWSLTITKGVSSVFNENEEKKKAERLSSDMVFDLAGVRRTEGRGCEKTFSFEQTRCYHASRSFLF